MAKVIVKDVPAGNYVKIHNSVAQDGFLTPGEKAVFLYLTSLPSGASASHDDIANALQVSRNTVRSYANAMREKGVIRYAHSGGKSGHAYISVYTVEADPDKWMRADSERADSERADFVRTDSDRNYDQNLHAPTVKNCAQMGSNSVHVYKDYKTKLKTNKDQSSSSSSENSGTSESSRPDTTSDENFHTAWDSLSDYPRIGKLSTCKEFYSQLVSEGNDPEKIAKGVAAVAENFEGDEKFRPGLERVLKTGQWEKELVKAKKKEAKDQEMVDLMAGIERAIRRQAGKED